MRNLLAGSSLLIALFIAGTAYAHHSGAGVDRTKTVTVEGIVKQFRWANPHSWLEIEVPNSKGSTDTWNLEMTSPAFLVRAGWKSTSIKPGDKGKAVARRFRNGDPGGLLVAGARPEGSVLVAQAAH